MIVEYAPRVAVVLFLTAIVVAMIGLGVISSRQHAAARAWTVAHCALVSVTVRTHTQSMGKGGTRRYEQPYDVYQCPDGSRTLLANDSLTILR